MDTQTSHVTATWQKSTVFRTLEAIRPWIQWLMVVIMALISWYIYYHDVTIQSSNAIIELQKQQTMMQKTMDERNTEYRLEIQRIRSEMITRELFEERTGSMKQQMKEIDARTIEILNRLPAK